MADTPRTSTLLATERAMRRWVLLVFALSSVLSALLLAFSFARTTRAWWLVCALAAALPLLSNAYYLRIHTQTTIGMMPVALLALLPASCTMLVAHPIPSWLRTLCVVVASALIALLVVFGWWFWRLRTTYSAQASPGPDAALIVLGGAIKRGRPCQTLVRRLDVTVRLWQQQPSLTIVVTGGPTPDGRTTEAREMSRYLREHGVAAASILEESTARNTQENLARSKALLAHRGFSGPLCVVSSDYHLWRACRDARRIGLDLVPIAAPTPWPSIPQQWCREVLTILSGR